MVDGSRQQDTSHAVLLLSHNGMDVDLKLASRVSGIDVISAAILTMPCRSPSRSPIPAEKRGDQCRIERKISRCVDLDIGKAS